MHYEEALQRWGAKKLTENNYGLSEVILDTVEVKMDFNAGYACCGGRDPDCYCSFAESPSSNVFIKGTAKTDKGETFQVQYEISLESFNFVEILKELVDIGEGRISSEPSIHETKFVWP